MKKYLLLFVFLFCMSQTNGQITITQSDMPEVDDTLRSSTSFFTTTDFTLSGTNFSWDFTDLVPFSQKVDTFVSVWSTPLAYNIVFLYPFVSTIAMQQPDIFVIPGMPYENVYYFYKESSSSFSMVGYGAEIAGVPSPVKYDDADVLYTFPAAYGNLDSSSSNFSQSIPYLGYFAQSKKRVNTIDGWGTITTPFGSFQALRMKSDITQFDSLYIDSLNFGFGIPRNYTEYKWLAKGYGEPVLTVTDNGLSYTITYIDSARKVILSAEESLSVNDNWNIFPNPNNGSFILDLPSFSMSKAMLRLLNIEGQQLWFKIINSSAKNIRLSVNLTYEGIKPGMYMLEFISGDQKLSKKIVIY